MEAAGAPRLDAERPSNWSAASYAGRWSAWGHRGGTRAVLVAPPMPLRWPRDEARAS